ncbi:junctional sarcoplasmic reticulum protein 1-like [Limosa lapponica baueri]|uniref:Junctional sarcoplasmic reticulum protein 1-like n=1 Tax=Limosa lapponica baueri TaxID=1758121 RepID=A0A2I0T8K8_LIMLA|nr:junctional sarcoplasmic reticulum protein 1-like [Limosa lapponica baueri]
MPEPAPLGGDKKAAEKKRVEKVGAKGSATSPPVPRSLPVQRKVEPPSLDPAEEPLLWEGLTLNKCILVASVVALLSVTFQVLQEVVSPKEEVQEVVTAQPPQPESSMVEADDGDDDGGDDGEDDDEADSNLAEPWIFKKWFGRSAPKDKDEDENENENEDEDEDEDEDKEPVDVPEVPPVVMEAKKSREKKLEKKEKVEKEEKAREGHGAMWPVGA